MEEEAAREEANRDWAKKQEENKKKDESKLGKSQKRREKAKARKSKVNSGGKTEESLSKEINLAAGRPQIPDIPEGSVEVVLENGIVIHDD